MIPLKNLLKVFFAWLFLILAGVFGLASRMFSGMAGMFNNCSVNCPWIPNEWLMCQAKNLICMFIGPFFQATFYGLLGISILFFVFASVIFWRWDK